MSFEATRSVVVLGAVTTGYRVDHPVFSDAALGNVGSLKRNTHLELTNTTAGLAFVAFDRVVTPPSGNGVQGSALPPAQYPNTGPVAATPGDFDICIPSATGWSAVDCIIPYGSQWMTVYTVAAGAICVNYGMNDNG